MAPRTPSKKKTLSAKLAKSPAGSYKHKVPAARRCQKCPNRPLRSQCEHTKAGRAYRENESSSISSPLPPSSPIPSSPLLPDPFNVPSPMASTPTPLPATHPYSHLRVDRRAFSLGYSNNMVQSSHTGSHYDSGILSSLPPTPQTISTVPTTPIPITVASPAPSTPVPAVEVEAPSPTQSSHARARITAGNAIYGFVEGAKQGNGQYSIVRTKSLRPAQPDAREAGKRFHRGMRDLIVRVENLSRETGAWIYLAGQHVNGAKGYTNYASPRLRRDAKSELTVIQNHFNTMSSALITSRRREAVELSIALEKANMECRTAQGALAELQDALDTSDLSATLGKDAFIAKLRALVAVSAGSSEP